MLSEHLDMVERQRETTLSNEKLLQQRTNTTINRKNDLKGFKENTTIQPNPQQPTNKPQRKCKNTTAKSENTAINPENTATKVSSSIIINCNNKVNKLTTKP